MVIKDYLYRAKNMLDFIESARSGVPCDKSTSRTRIFHWGTVSAEHLEALLAFLPSDECGIRTLELGGDCGIGPEGAARLMAAIAKCASVRTLNLGGATLGVEGAKVIAAALGATPLVSLEIDGDTIGDEGCVAIARAYAGLPRMTALKIVNNEDVGARGAVAVAAALAKHQAKGECLLESLNFSGCPIGDKGLAALAAALGERFPRELCLTTTAIGGTSEGMAALGAALGSGRCGLAHLDLMNNQIDAAGAKLLAAALPRSKLESLMLHWNDIQSEGAVAIAEALQSGSKEGSHPLCLKELYLCDNEIDSAGALAFAHTLRLKGAALNLEVLDLMGNPLDKPAALALALADKSQRHKPLRKLELGLFAVDADVLQQAVDEYDQDRE